jgi:hypothetical protein
LLSNVTSRVCRQVETVEIFYPFSYPKSFFSTPWDLVIIEGWFLSINTFIHEVSTHDSSIFQSFGVVSLRLITEERDRRGFMRRIDPNPSPNPNPKPNAS